MFDLRTRLLFYSHLFSHSTKIVAIFINIFIPTDVIKCLFAILSCFQPCFANSLTLAIRAVMFVVMFIVVCCLTSIDGSADEIERFFCSTTSSNMEDISYN